MPKPTAAASERGFGIQVREEYRRRCQIAIAAAVAAAAAAAAAAVLLLLLLLLQLLLLAAADVIAVLAATAASSYCCCCRRRCCCCGYRFHMTEKPPQPRRKPKVELDVDVMLWCG